MQFFKNLGDQFKKFWGETAPAARIGMIATMVFSIVLVVGVGYWSSLPNYVPLQDNMTPEQYVKVIDELAAKGIRYKTSPGGSSIQVEQSKLPLARSIIDQQVGTPNAFNEGMFSGIPGPEVRKERMLREKELRLGASIAKINGINQATVHLTIRKQRLLKNNQTQSKASVMLELAPNYTPSQEVIETIAALVSYVDGLAPEKVAISDINGRKYTVNDPINRLFDDKQEYKRNLENDRRTKVEHILNGLVGFGNYSVTVTADVDVKKLDRSKKTYVGEGNETSSKSVMMKNDRPDNSNGRGGGASANQTGSFPPPGKIDRAISDGEWKEIVKVYDEVTEKEIDVVNTIQQISVAAIVEIPETEDGSAPALTKERIEALIKNAAGIVESRDLVQVEIGQLAANPIMDEILATDLATPTTNNDFLLQMVRNSSLGLGAVFALVIGFLMLRKIKPVTITEPEPQISAEKSRHVADLTMVAKENPEFLSQVIRSWMNEPSQSDEPKSDSATGVERRNETQRAA